MTKFDHWPLWLQVLIGIPHLVLLVLIVWIWWPKSNRGWYWFVGVLVYLWIFYLAFMR
jgi:hypothetical protein